VRILIAEDERIRRLTLRRQLERWGYSAVTVENGSQAWEEFQRQQFDRVVTDWDMPEMDGRQLTQHIRTSNPASYVYLILLTGRTDKADLVAGMEAGADDFLSKPFDRNELRVRLHAGEQIIQLEKDLALQNQELASTLAELKESQTALVQAEKIGSLGRLVAGVEHEINTPLGALRSGVDTMRRAAIKIGERCEKDFGESSEGVNRLVGSLVSLATQVQAACERIDRIVANLRQFAHLDRADFQRLDIHPGLESTLHLLRHEFGDDIEVNTEYGETPEIDCAPRELNQLFMNLLLNAKDAIDSAGQHGEIRVRTWCDGDRLKVEIADNGCGIPAEHLSKIFDPGFATKGVQVGTGLGCPSATRSQRRTVARLTSRASQKNGHGSRSLSQRDRNPEFQLGHLLLSRTSPLPST
jgi:two-component system NtrC family sensor kinase